MDTTRRDLFRLGALAAATAALPGLAAAGPASRPAPGVPRSSAPAARCTS
ncbi:hypothetical protein [Pseudoxanthomonas suwonensis]